MTTETDLRHLLASEADGAVRAPADWDDVVRRGVRHRRASRIRAGFVAGGVAALAVGVLFGSGSLQPEDEQRTAAGPAATATTGRNIEPPPEPDLEVASSQDTTVTVLLGPALPDAGFDPCADLTIRVSESTGEVVLDVDPGFETPGSEPWAACESGPVISWGRVELANPLDSRALIDASDDLPLAVVDGPPLLFPTWVPETYDLTRRDDVATFVNDEAGWAFRFTAGSKSLTVHNGPLGGGSCGGDPVEVRGVDGRLCDGAGPFRLVWSEGDTLRVIDLDKNGTDVTAADVLRIAEGLEPLG